MGSRQADPPDGGYGWVVVSSAFVVMGLTVAIHRNFGLFFLELQNHFGVLNSSVSWVTSIAITMLHLGAPVASALTTKYSHRAVIIVGALLCGFGMTLGSLDINLPWMYFTVGILQGAGVAFCWLSASSMVNHYFSRWRPIAYAIASSGECVFAMAFSPFIQWLIEAYGWQGALLIIGGLQFNLCICGALMRPLRAPVQRSVLQTKDHPDGDAVEAVPAKRSLQFQWSLLKKPEFILYIVFGILTAVGFFVPPLFLVPFAASLGVDPYWTASILSVFALSDLGGRLICGWFANMQLVRNLQLLTIVTTMLAVVLLLLPYSHSYVALMAFASGNGFLFGCVVAVHITSIVDIVSLKSFESGLGLYMFFRTIGGFIGPPAAGWLTDWTLNYGAGFYFAGLTVIIAAVFAFIVDHLVQKKKATQSDTTESMSDNDTHDKVTKQKCVI